jgi:toluene monooxygenase system protein E
MENELGNPRQRLKTYSHLANLGRKPNDYDLATRDMLYYVKRGLEVNMPFTRWSEKYQIQASLKCRDWEAVVDPRHTTYTKYVTIQKSQEQFVDRVLERIEKPGYLSSFDAKWVAQLSRLLPPFRFAGHGFQMIASYFAHLAPSGRIVIPGLFQAADEMRRVQRFAYMTGLMRTQFHDFGSDSLQLWQSAPNWQPLRRLVEKLLVTYDWSEAFAVLNFYVKPKVDQFICVELGHLAADHGDYLLGEILDSLHQDCIWHQKWSGEVMRVLFADEMNNKLVMDEWQAKWQPFAQSAVEALKSEAAIE